MSTFKRCVIVDNTYCVSFWALVTTPDVIGPDISCFPLGSSVKSVGSGIGVTFALNIPYARVGNPWNGTIECTNSMHKIV